MIFGSGDLIGNTDEHLVPYSGGNNNVKSQHFQSTKSDFYHRIPVKELRTKIKIDSKKSLRNKPHKRRKC